MLRFFWVGLALCAALFTPSFFPDLFAPVDSVLDDLRTRFVIRSHPESRIVIVDVDERSIAAQGAWPWPRATIARLLQILIDDYGVASISMDMVFPEARPDESSLVTQLQRPQITGAIVFDLDKRNLPESHLPFPSATPLHTVVGAPLVFGVPVFANHAELMPPRAGHITPTFDADGAVRRLPPVICRTATDCYPSLALAAYSGMMEHPYLDLQPGHGLFSPAWELALRTDDGSLLSTMPLLSNGMLMLPYRHVRHDWTSVSAADILERKPDRALLKGVMVVVGGTALGLSDVITTPVSVVAAGVEPHAELLSALLDNDFPVVPQRGMALDAMLLLPFGVLLAWTLGRFGKPVQRAAAFPAWLLFAWLSGAALSVLALRNASLLLPLTPILLFPPLALLFAGLPELYRAGRERAGILKLLSAYLPSQVAIRLAAFGRVGTTVDASRREITVLFADIHGFARLSEGQSPEVIARLMQRVFTEMAESIVAHQGTIDKFIGDAIMAFWNAPEDDAGHAGSALAAAQDILLRMDALLPFCEELGLPPISIGVGMETGQALVGNFGPAHRRTYTALGEPVVLASRIESLTREKDQAILIGEGCAAALGMQGLRMLESVQIRGRVHPLTLYVPH